MSQETPTLAQVMQDAIYGILKDVHTHLPGAVTKYDKDTQLADVQPQLQRKYVDGTVVDLPIVRNVPVIYPSGKDWYVHRQLEVGDTVALAFSERSLDKWITSGGKLLPDDNRMFDLSDAVAIPGLKPQSKPFELKGKEKSYVIFNKGNFIELSEKGKFKVENETAELISVLSDVLTELVTELDDHVAGQHLTGVGPLGKDPAYLSALNARKTALEGLKEKLDSFKE